MLFKNSVPYGGSHTVIRYRAPGHCNFRSVSKPGTGTKLVVSYLDLPLHKDSEPLVEPEVLKVLIGHQVPSP